MAELLLTNIDSNWEKERMLKRRTPFFTLHIYYDGEVHEVVNERKGWTVPTRSKAVILPPHGTLKDTDFMLSCLEEIKKDYPEAYKLVSGIIERTPTVVEAT